MGDGNSFPFVVWLLLVILACLSIVLCKCSGNVLLDIIFLAIGQVWVIQDDATLRRCPSLAIELQPKHN